MITTVRGAIPAEALGPTSCHEHLLIGDGRPVELEPGYRLDDVDAAVREVTSMRAAGGSAVVDCMPMGVGRDPDGLLEISERTGVTVIATSGFHRDAFYASGHWVRELSAAELAQRVIDETRHGMERPPERRLPAANGRSRARPGLLKAASSGDEPTGLETKLLAAVGSAAATTGLPVITHTESVSGALRQLDMLRQHGVSPERVILSHMDRHGDVNGVAEVCATGATVCLDWLGRIDRRPDQAVVDLVVALLEKGFGEHVVLGQDLARRAYWQAYGGGPGLSHLFTSVVPLLGSAGLSDQQVATILVTTPRRVLAQRTKES